LKVWYRIAIIDLWVLVGSNIILNGYVLLTTEVEGFNAFTLFLVIIWVASSFVIPIALLLIVTILRLIRGFTPAWYFLTAYLVLALTFLFQETRPGEFDNAEIHISNFRIIIENSALLLGAILQFLIFSLGLARKMKLDEEEKKLAQGKIIEQLKENEKLKDKVNRELEGKVRERTREISEQKEEIESQRDEIEAQRYEVETQRDEVEAQRDQLETQRDLVVEQKDEIIDSINYAKRIQSAMLPPETYVTELLNENFIFYKPRDIVSGDFYWIKHVNQYIVLLAADCTGHGVPGALMSMLGISYLNEIVQRREITQANQILNELRKQIKHSLRQHGQPDEAKDGIDMALCVLDLRNMLMQYSGANNPLYLIRDVDDIPDLKEIKADRMPIGYYQGKDKTFTNHNIQLQIGDTFYIFSDGFIDQKGGKENKKFMNKNFKKLLLEIHDQPMYDQKNILDKALSDWMGSYSQMDDILVIGVRM
jgi:serine phosphatase RsbU (regulator of sigma subunit)